MQSPWLLRRPGNAAARLRLYCFPYAGGHGAAFLPWQAALDPVIEVCAVQLPGRGARFAEPVCDSFTALIETLAHVIAKQRTSPFAFFGHSLGALIAFEVTRYQRRHGMAMPEHLVVSGCDAPQHRRFPQRLHRLPDDALIATLKDYNGTPAEVLQHRELMQLMLPAIRGDFALASDYTYRPGPLLDLPITVLAGGRDRHVVPDHVQAWGQQTSNACRIHWFDGDHFFIDAQRTEVLACLATELASMPHR